MRVRIFLSLLLTFSVPGLLLGRIVKSWTYQEMFDRADLVVIASVVSTKETDERTALQDLEPHVRVIGVVTEFKTNVVLKGPRSVATFRLHHYRLHSEDDLNLENGPDLVRFLDRHPSFFLLFLIKERGGSYAPVTGQTDPAAFSVLELRGGAN